MNENSRKHNLNKFIYERKTSEHQVQYDRSTMIQGCHDSSESILMQSVGDPCGGSAEPFIKIHKASKPNMIKYAMTMIQ